MQKRPQRAASAASLVALVTIAPVAPATAGTPTVVGDDQLRDASTDKAMRRSAARATTRVALVP